MSTRITGHVALITSVLLCLAVEACGTSDIELVVHSPDGAYDAVLARFNPGAMSSMQTLVWVRRVGRPDVYPFTDVVFDADRGYDVRLEWTPQALLIRCPSCEPTRVSVKNSTSGSIAIEYPDFATQPLTP